MSLRIIGIRNRHPDCTFLVGRITEMKNFLILCSFVATGLLSAEPKLSYNERIALETSSPRVHLAKKHEMKKVKSEDEMQQNVAKEGYRVEKDKTTIVAFVPVGK